MLRYQLPVDGEIVPPKHPGGIYKTVRINYGIMDLLVFHRFLNSRIYLLMPYLVTILCMSGNWSCLLNQHTNTTKCNQITESPR